ncbi:hypothetical protein RBU49_15620 [Clostridium sp. MB40-C1]|uniref:CsxC family protein n=1 Tax=Clostridium sp. MB40-C1 TaxID=3070996 RepID=UPI0027DF2162|nr:hypothetical protein [Clostridium sp. MB40-C1]WMJ80231.1 hypothetical protein RBU49_15620 [Clostridium sp. MB40-C1]
MEHKPNRPFCGNVDAETLTLCQGTNMEPSGTSDPVVAKIPVVLAERTIQIDVEADICLQYPFYDIKRIKKDIFLTQCKLILTTEGTNTGKLFLEGFVRKNIEYTTADCVDCDVVSGGVHHTTADVPFRCATEVVYSTPPVFCTRTPAESIELICNKGCGGGCCHKCGEETLGTLPCEQNFIDTICYTEKPYCELEEARIYEADIHKERLDKVPGAPYNKITEKMVIYLRLKVLQNQQVNINGVGVADPDTNRPCR